jgi:hypothetical protein
MAHQHTPMHIHSPHAGRKMTTTITTVLLPAAVTFGQPGGAAGHPGAGRGC